jgi:hypothetical protein
MADIALVTAGDVRVVRPIDQYDGIAGETIAAGAVVRFHTTSGHIVNGNGSGAAEAMIIGIATKDAVQYQPVTVLRQGVMDGFDLDDQDVGADLFASDTDGTVGDAAGTVTVRLGYVEARFAGDGVTADKLFYVNVQR